MYIFREDSKANAMCIETAQSKSEREKKKQNYESTFDENFTRRLAQSTQNYKSFDFIPITSVRGPGIAAFT